MGALLSSLYDCLGRDEAPRPGLLDHYHQIQNDMCEIERLLEQRVKNSRCC